MNQCLVVLAVAFGLLACKAKEKSLTVERPAAAPMQVEPSVKPPATGEVARPPTAAQAKQAPAFAADAFDKVAPDAKKAVKSFTTALMNDDREAIIAMLAPGVDGCQPEPAKLADLQTSIRKDGARSAFSAVAKCEGTTCTWPGWKVMFNAKANRIGIEPADDTGSNGYLLDKQPDGAWKLSRFCANNSMADRTVKPG